VPPFFEEYQLPLPQMMTGRGWDTAKGVQKSATESAINNLLAHFWRSIK
jgi:hypothetical protein